MLGPSVDPEHPVEPKTGRVFHEGLLSELVAASKKAGPVVHVVPFERAEWGGRTDEYRELEASVWARYLRWLVKRSGVNVADPVSGARRGVGYGNVAILAIATTNLKLLFSARNKPLPSSDEPRPARGGKLFLDDLLHRQFLLGLRSIADREDGVAEATLLRRPFFSIDLLDVVRARTADEETGDERALRGRAAIEWVRDLGRRRFDRSPGETAYEVGEAILTLESGAFTGKYVVVWKKVGGQ